jgi:hypothetical protein
MPENPIFAPLKKYPEALPACLLCKDLKKCK